MSEHRRHQAVLQLLANRPFLSVHDLVAATGVSPATVRRDIEKLDAAGLSKKVHGGIAALEGQERRAVALPFIVNRDIATEAKRAIAKAAGQIVRDGSLIIIHAGSTCFHFGAHIADRNLRVFTNSMPLAAYLAENGTCQLTVGGGDLHREPGVLYDPQRAPDSFYGSQFFVGALGISSRGLLESHPLLVRFINEMVELANEVVVLVDSRKFAERPPNVALPLARVNRLITDDGLSDADAQMLEDQGVDYIIAETGQVAA
ncbi:DeoR family transcriptional regulator [Frigidibacter albus]|uniref:DeoR family transcriptional regulator n=1 Tax=Frigidibacter albus TaxID=1465486 RepID=A0A6L8VD65_9RHOB|nr:DeoR/GlpR family DNA-binding transcription regulator [Frigidibacter albus]MZQ87616.1 DeoR family transcriptional regulator [Frigidibacter albus]NBE29522.1 DeoR family transcriptional regulator [Frigidibacter albus]